MSVRAIGLVAAVSAMLLGQLSLACQPCGCRDAASAREWQSDPAAYRAAGSPPPAEGMQPDEAALHREFGQARATKVYLGKAVYYGAGLAGNKTANGEIFDPEKFTAAHRELPFGTVVRVVRLDTGAHTYVRINDRGPFGSSERIIDLAEVAARRLDMIRKGVVEVRLEILRVGDGRRAR